MTDQIELPLIIEKKRSEKYEYVKAWKARNKDKISVYGKRYRLKHPETHKRAALRYRKKHLIEIRKRDRIEKRKLRKQDPEGQKIRYKRWRLKKEAQLVKIAGRPRPAACELCGGREIGGKNAIVFDHCHAKGHFRGWICDRCNKVLGIVKDSSVLLRKMAEYLEASNGSAYSGNKEENTDQGIRVTGREEIPVKR